MNKLLKFKQTENQKVYWLSDTHLNHNPKWPIPIWRGRGFNSVSEMNDSIIDSINQNVRVDDILFFLGDFVLNCSESQFEEFLSKILCQNIYMLFGNHNSCVWSCYEREVERIKKDYELDDDISEIYPLKYRNIIFIGNYQEIVVDGSYFIISHYAMSVFNNSKDCSIMIHGHSHGNLKNSLPEETEYGKILDVSWDVFKKPVSTEEVLKIMSKKKVLILDHHGKT